MTVVGMQETEKKKKYIEPDQAFWRHKKLLKEGVPNTILTIIVRKISHYIIKQQRAIIHSKPFISIGKCFIYTKLWTVFYTVREFSPNVFSVVRQIAHRRFSILCYLFNWSKPEIVTLCKTIHCGLLFVKAWLKSLQ